MKTLFASTPALRCAHTLFRLACATVWLAVSGCTTVEGVTTSELADRTTEHVVTAQGQPTVVFDNGLSGGSSGGARCCPR